MRRTVQAVALLLLSGAVALAQTSTGPVATGGSSARTAKAKSAATTKSTAATKSTATTKKTTTQMKPFSRLALGGGVGVLGINGQLTTNVSRHVNLRATGNLFNYDYNGYSTNGFNLNAGLRMATAGASVDYYPFATHGLRLSAGGLFYNQNRIKAAATVAGGSSFTLNDTDYYSANANSATGASPVTLTGLIGLNQNKQSLTLTTGWGNQISRTGGHWSFPFEFGAALTGAPKVNNVKLTGWACADYAQTNCADLSGTSSVASDVNTSLTEQIAKWQKDLNQVKAYPVFSFGVSYNFQIRK